jgi:MYXO-CTERM domain-containing protein
MNVRTRVLSRAGFLSACLALAVATFATNVNGAAFTIDASQSSLSILVGVYDGDTFTPLTSPQAPGSDTTSLLGTLDVNYDGLTLGIGGGAIDFALQPTEMQPLSGGLPGAAPADYGLIVDLQGLVTGPGAARNLGASLSLASTALVGNSFLSDGALLSLVAGVLDVNLTGFTTVQDSLDISGNSGANTGGSGTFDLVGLNGTIQIPIFVEALVPVEVSEGFVLPLVARFEGQIVATGLVPEPSSMVLGAVGLVGLGAVARRRRRS